MESMPRIRDFIETTDGLIFSVVSYHHPTDMRLAFLRYYKSPDGERMRGEERYSKVSSTLQSYKFLEKNFPEYICPYEGSRLQAVPCGKIKEVHHPQNRLMEICENPKSPLEQKIVDFSEIFEGIPESHKGITGSVLIGLHTPASDIDFVVYGLSNHKKARDIFKDSVGGKIRELPEEMWQKSYEKRFSCHDTLSFDEYLWHEKRKWHKGTIDGTIFDILLVRDRSEIGPKPAQYARKTKITVECTVTDSALAFDSPSVYRVECDYDGRIKDVLSYTHTYAGQAFDGEKIEVCGFLEEAADKSRRVVVGTTREAVGEYIKVEPI